MRVGLLRPVAALPLSLILILSSTGVAFAQDSNSANAAANVSTGQGTEAGGDVSTPVLIKQVDPQFSEEARQKGASGTVLVSIIVDTHGLPQNVHVLRGLGMGLDENAVEAVKQFCFKPAMQNDKPLAMQINVEVHFGNETSPAPTQNSTAAQAERAQLAASLGLGTTPTPVPAAPRKVNHVLGVSYGSHVPGEPISATRTLDYEPAADSSDPKPYHAEEKFFRDAAGRTRSEFTYPDRPATVDILDFVAHLHYHWTVGGVVEQFNLPEPAPPRAETVPLSPGAPQIEGVPTRHTRGTNSNTQQATESWYAPDLHLALLTIVDQPGTGKTTYRFSHIDRTEPAASLFQVPLDMTIRDMTSLASQQNASAARPPTAGAAAQPSSPVAAIPASHPAYLDDPKFQKALADAKSRRGTSEDLLAAWKNANKAAKGECLECLHQILDRQIRLAQWKDVVETTTQLESVSTEPRDRYQASYQRGQALLHAHDDSPKSDQLTQADASFRAALALSPNALMAIYSEGRVLAMLGRNADAGAMFTKYVALAGASDRYRPRAQHFIQNPGLAAQRMAPPFTLTTLQGDQISLDDMNGKIVLLDFWATWCGPCRASLPELQRIAEKFADQPLVVISISSDKDEAAWKKYILQNHMVWPQYRDADGALSLAYGVDVIPHYFTIDTDGVLQKVQVGSNSNVEGELHKLLKAHDADKKKTNATSAGGN